MACPADSASTRSFFNDTATTEIYSLSLHDALPISNVGATHSHTPENVLANHPGVKVVVPATAADAKGLLKSAIRDNDPVFFLENTILYGEKGEVPEGEHVVPLGLADVKRAGTDLTIVTY